MRRLTGAELRPAILQGLESGELDAHRVRAVWQRGEHEPRALQFRDARPVAPIGHRSGKEGYWLVLLSRQTIEHAVQIFFCLRHFLAFTGNPSGVGGHTRAMLRPHSLNLGRLRSASSGSGAPLTSL
jgi:hypothetical protein